MSDSKQADPNIEYSLRQNDIRALICCAAAGTLLVNVSWSSLFVIESLVAMSVLSYALGSYLWLKQISHSPRAATLFDRVMTMDAAVIGLVVSFSGFNILPTILFITMIQFNSLINGGVKKWAIDNVAFFVGVGFTFLIREPQLVFSDKLEISAVSLIGIFTYFCAYALYAHNRIHLSLIHI